MRARARRQRQDKMRRMEKDCRGVVGLRVVTRLGITYGNEGDEAAVAFYPYLLMAELDQGICTTMATLCMK